MGLIDAIENNLAGEKLSSEEGQEIINGAEKQVQSIFYTHRFSIANRGIKDINKKLQREILIKDASIIDETLNELFNSREKLKKQQISFGIKSYFRQLPDAGKRYITTLCYRIFLFQILNLDPSLQELQIDWFKSRRLYLDTNIIIALLCLTDKKHGFVKEIISATM